jgi:hypothetical protein
MIQAPQIWKEQVLQRFMVFLSRLLQTSHLAVATVMSW